MVIIIANEDYYSFFNFIIGKISIASHLAEGQVIELEATLRVTILFLVKFKLYTPLLDYIMQITYSVIIKGLTGEYISNNAFYMLRRFLLN